MDMEPSVQPYVFQTQKLALVPQPDGTWIVDFEASIYSVQVFEELDNVVAKDGIRVITIAIVGREEAALAFEPGDSQPFKRGKETRVQLMLVREDHITDQTLLNYP